MELVQLGCSCLCIFPQSARSFLLEHMTHTSPVAYGKTWHLTQISIGQSLPAGHPQVVHQCGRLSSVSVNVVTDQLNATVQPKHAVRDVQ
jgi:hypothetical protein